MASSFGAKVAVCEDLYIGGTCVNVGCVPKKLYVYASEYAAHFHDAKGFGWQMAKPKFDWPTLRQNKTAEIRRLNAIYEDILDQANVDIIEGRGKILDPHTVEVAGQRYSAERILIAVGGWPFIPDVPGREYAVSTNEVFDLESFPEYRGSGGGTRCCRICRYLQRSGRTGDPALPG